MPHDIKCRTRYHVTFWMLCLGDTSMVLRIPPCSRWTNSACKDLPRHTEICSENFASCELLIFGGSLARKLGGSSFVAWFLGGNPVWIPTGRIGSCWKGLVSQGFGHYSSTTLASLLGLKRWPARRLHNKTMQVWWFFRKNDCKYGARGATRHCVMRV